MVSEPNQYKHLPAVYSLWWCFWCKQMIVLCQPCTYMYKSYTSPQIQTCKVTKLVAKRDRKYLCDLRERAVVYARRPGLINPSTDLFQCHALGKKGLVTLSRFPCAMSWLPHRQSDWLRPQHVKLLNRKTVLAKSVTFITLIALQNIIHPRDFLPLIHSTCTQKPTSVTTHTFPQSAPY